MIVKKVIFEVNGKVVETLNGYHATSDDIILVKVAMAIKYSVQEDDVDVRNEDEDVSYLFDTNKMIGTRIKLGIMNGRKLSSAEGRN